MNPKKFNISDAELEVLKVLWDGGPGNVRDVAARMRPAQRQRAYTTLQTLLNRLLAKGYVEADKDSIPHTYRATASREALVRDGLNDLAGQLCEGAASPLVMALISNKKFSAEEISSFRRMLDEAESKHR